MSGCPPVVGETAEETVQRWVCFKTREEAKRQFKILNLEQELADVRLDLVRAEGRGLKKYGRLWANVGVEYLPNVDEDQYQPYAIGGVTLGPIGIWGGFFGDDPAIGLGWQF